MRARRATIAGLAAVVALAAAPALAASDGVYDHERMGCSLLSYTYDRRNEAEPGCQGFTVQAGPAEHPDLVRVGFDQTPEGVGPHAGSVKVGEAGASPTDDENRFLVILFDTGVAIVGPRTLTDEESEPPRPERVSDPRVDPAVRPSNAPAAPGRPLEWSVFFWMDDNFTVFGEHHSISQANDPERDAPVAQGPVSGGGIRTDTHPDAEDPRANVDPSDRARPVRAAEARAGFCADGWCLTIQTEERTVYRGGSERSRPAYDYAGLHPADCDFRDPGPNCREQYDAEGRVFAPWGVTIYQDPDPQSPKGLGPAAGALHPLPPTHAGAHGLLLAGVWVIDLRDGAPAAGPGTAVSQQLDRREAQDALADVLEVVDLGTLLARLEPARRADVVVEVDHRPVREAAPRATGVHADEEVGMDVPVERRALAGPETDLPDADAVVLEQQPGADPAGWLG